MLLGFGIVSLSLAIATGVGYIMPETVIIPVTQDEITTYSDMLRNFQTLHTQSTNPNSNIAAFNLVRASLPEEIYLDRTELQAFITNSLPIYTSLEPVEQLIYQKYMAHALTLNALETAPEQRLSVDEIKLTYNRNLQGMHSMAEEYRNLPKYESPILPVLGMVGSLTILAGVIIYKTYNR